MKFIILTQYYPPETGAPQNRLSDLARRLGDAGHEVTVLTAKPNYPAAVIHEGYRGGLWKERMDGRVRVIHCWLYPSKSKRVSLRLLNYLSFVFSSAMIGALKLRRADFLLVESPPLFLGLTGWWLSRLERARMIFNVSDLYPETAVALGYLRPGRALDALTALERWCYGKSALVTGQTAGIVESIRRRFPEARVHLLTNGVDVKDFAEMRRSGDVSSGGFTVGYAGVLGHAQGLDVILDAARILERDGSGVQFEIWGEGPLQQDLERRAGELGLTSVRFRGHAPRSRILEAIASWDAGLVPLVDTPVMAGALPSKMFEVMAAGLPVVLSAPRGEASALIERAEAGVWSPARNAESLADALRTLARDRGAARKMGERGRAHVFSHYDRAQIAQRFLEVLG